MARPTDSFKKFNYALRPTKQVERKIMIEVLLRLSKAGYDITDYSYLGFGSPYYVDFVMFHKYLFMDNMVCVEWGDVPRRMRFNKPFKFIKLKMQALSQFIPSVRPNKKYLVWLDYDRSLDSEMLQDLDGCLSRLARCSIFVTTVDARPRLPSEFAPELETLTAEEKEKFTLGIYRDWFGKYLAAPITLARISGQHVTPLFYEVTVERIRQTLARQGRGLRFLQIFNYAYKDGAPMLTLGGIVGTDDDEKLLKDKGILGHPFVRTGPDYLEISVPPLTTREKYWLDSRLDKRLTANTLIFELDDEPLQNYLKFYKEYPTYLEALL
jgi:hypothetical protein